MDIWQEHNCLFDFWTKIQLIESKNTPFGDKIIFRTMTQNRRCIAANEPLSIEASFLNSKTSY